MTDLSSLEVILVNIMGLTNWGAEAELFTSQQAACQTPKSAILPRPDRNSTNDMM